jgi:hypothetical protein
MRPRITRASMATLGVGASACHPLLTLTVLALIRLHGSFIDWKCQTMYDKEGAEIVPRPRDEDALAEEHLEAWVSRR